MTSITPGGRIRAQPHAGRRRIPGPSVTLCPCPGRPAVASTVSTCRCSTRSQGRAHRPRIGARCLPSMRPWPLEASSRTWRSARITAPACSRSSSIRAARASSRSTGAMSSHRTNGPRARRGIPTTPQLGWSRHLSQVPGADLAKLSTIDGTTGDLDPADLRIDLCLIDGEHTNAAALQDARFCRRAVRDQGVIVFHDRLIVDRGIQRFLAELSGYHAYPLAHDLFVVEIGVPSLLGDERVRLRVPRSLWLTIDRLRAVRPVLRLAPIARTARRGAARVALAVGAPRRSGRPSPKVSGSPQTPFEIHTFVNDDALYARMRESFIDAGFDRTRSSASAIATTIHTPRLRASDEHRARATRSSATRTCSPIRAPEPRSCSPVFGSSTCKTRVGSWGETRESCEAVD